MTERIRVQRQYQSPNGYYGELYNLHWFIDGRKYYELRIIGPDGEEVLHSYNAEAKTMEDLKEVVDSFPKLTKLIEGTTKRLICHD